MTGYYTADGTEVTRRDIEYVVKQGLALLIWSHGQWRNRAGLVIYNCQQETDDAEMRLQTIGQRWSMWDETWTERPTLAEALRVAA